MKIRVLVADDSATVREQVTRWLADEPDMEVVATARDGTLVTDKVAAKRVDVALLDVDMPGVGGLEALRSLRARHPRMPVIMFSALTERGGAVTLEALSLGASDYVLKPTSAANVPGASPVTPDDVRVELVDKIRKLHERASAPPVTIPPHAGGPRPAPPAATTRRPRAVATRVDVIAIGSSTGGPTALELVFRAFPADLRVPVVVVQHMPPLFTTTLAERLQRTSALRVAEARDGDRPTPGTAWIAPGGKHLVLEMDERGFVLRTNEDPPENSCRPSVDVLFRSVARTCGAHALGVVLTGMGHDGLDGARALVGAGSDVLAQDEPSSVVWGMPGAIATEGLAAALMPPTELGDEVVRRASRTFGGPP